MRKFSHYHGGFSLVELLTVMAIMAIMVVISIPAIEGVLSTDNRKQAVDTVLQTMEQARIAALQNGVDVYLVLAMPRDSGATPDAMIVVGDPPLASTSSAPILFSKWVRLPKAVRFFAYQGSLVGSDIDNSRVPSQVQAYISTDQLPPLSGNPSYAALTFGSTGSLEYPLNTSLTLAFYEGLRSGTGMQIAEGATAKATQNLSPTGIFDTVRLSPYTGRAWYEVSSLND
jgi:prepilin-type N-terminal cleavage/methylation domain-containing protein